MQTMNPHEVDLWLWLLGDLKNFPAYSARMKANMFLFLSPPLGRSLSTLDFIQSPSRSQPCWSTCATPYFLSPEPHIILNTKAQARGSKLSAKKTYLSSHCSTTSKERYTLRNKSCSCQVLNTFCSQVKQLFNLWKWIYFLETEKNLESTVPAASFYGGWGWGCLRDSLLLCQLGGKHLKIKSFLLWLPV